MIKIKNCVSCFAYRENPYLYKEKVYSFETRKVEEVFEEKKNYYSSLNKEEWEKEFGSGVYKIVLCLYCVYNYRFKETNFELNKPKEEGE